MTIEYTLTWAKVRDGEIVRLSTELPRFDEDTPRDEGDPDGRVITEAGAAGAGWHEIVYLDPPPIDDTTQARSLAALLVDGVPTVAWEVRDLSLEDMAAALAAAKSAKLAAAERAYEMAATTPFAWDFGMTPAVDDLEGESAAGLQTLQIRHLEDKTNWTALQAAAQLAIISGAPDQVLPLKTTANQWVQAQASLVLDVLIAGRDGYPSLFQRQSALLTRYGALKATIAAAPSLAALAAIDLAAGWPGQD